MWGEGRAGGSLEMALGADTSTDLLRPSKQALLPNRKLQAVTAALTGALRRTWLHPLLKRVLPKQGEVSRCLAGFASLAERGLQACIRGANAWLAVGRV